MGVYAQIEKETGWGVTCDQCVKMSSHFVILDYPFRIRKIKYKNSDSAKTLVILMKNPQFRGTDTDF
ncbi:MAG: hypothetical protein EBZ67_07785 [Chitinophagia bacterium]|nr:hypothetical protein [Chitinophagia bacterium]